MKQRILLLLLLVAALVLAACDSAPAESGEAIPPAEGQTSEVISDAISVTVPAGEPGVIVVEPVDPPDEVTAGGLTLPAGSSSTAAAIDTTELPVSANVHIIPATPYDNSQPSSPIGLPEHIRIDFAIDGQTEDVRGPVMFIIPTADYAALWEGAGDMGVSGTLAGLQALIRERYEPFPEAGIPALPVEQVGAAFNDLAVQGQYIDLDGLDGLRFVGRFVEGSDPVTNEGLTYVFQGFTDNGRYFISFFYPVTTAQLADNAAALDSVEAELFAADAMAYFAERVAALNALGPSDWSPDLTLLDNVLASLQIPAPEPVDVVAVDQLPLTGVTWPWQGTTGPAGETVVADPARYTITFNDDGSAFIVADCNTIRATYTAAPTGGLSLMLGPSTLVACPPDSQAQVFSEQLSAATSYALEGEGLSLVVADDGTAMRFAPAPLLAEGAPPETASESARPEDQPVATVVEEGVPSEEAAGLVGPIWQWTVLRQLNGETAVPEPARYSVTFNPDGRAVIQADCSVVEATYVAAPDGSLSLTLGPSAPPPCGEASLDQVFLGGLGASQSYALDGGALSITLQLENGTMVFTPAN